MKKLFLMVTVATSFAKTYTTDAQAFANLPEHYIKFDQCMNNTIKTGLNLEAKEQLQKCYQDFKQGLNKQRITNNKISPEEAEHRCKIVNKYPDWLEKISIKNQSPELKKLANQLSNELMHVRYQAMVHHTQTLAQAFDSELTFEQFDSLSADELKLNIFLDILFMIDYQRYPVTYIKYAEPKFNKA